MDIEYIDIPAGTKYLSQVEELNGSLPTNCIFNKGVVGCGGTTIALDNSKNYIICVPFITLIKNKEAQKENLLGVTGGTSEEVIRAYIEKPGVKKIMVTYDSLEKLIAIVGTNFSLLVDECHLLFTQYSFRKDAVQKVLRNYNKFNEFCFMTGTLLEEDFLLEELSKHSLIPLLRFRG